MNFQRLNVMQDTYIPNAKGKKERINSFGRNRYYFTEKHQKWLNACQCRGGLWAWWQRTNQFQICKQWKSTIHVL